MKKISPRIVFLLIGLVALSLLATAGYLQYGPERQQPCPLCILQRYMYMALAAVSLVAAAHGPGRVGAVLYGVLTGAIAGGGLYFAIWQVTKGASMTSCLADPIGEFVNGLPSANWWPEFLFANGGCADQYSPMLGLSVPTWSMLWFSAFALGSIGVVIAAVRGRSR